jgi:DNA ligase (NAD+)
MDISKNGLIEDLVEELNKANYDYYVKCEPTMSDYMFDMKMKQLEELEAETGYILPYSPTQRVGSDLQDGFTTVERKRIMGSIANCYDMEELKSWMESVDDGFNTWIVEPKYDGVSCSLIYVDGILVSASTRGSGLKGDNILENVKTIRSIPLKLRINGNKNEDGMIYPDVVNDYHFQDIYIPKYVEIRGEILMSKTEFKRINKEREEQGLPLFANERNCAAGSIKQLDPKVTASRKLLFMPFAVFVDEDDKFNKLYLDRQAKALTVANIFGFNVPNYWLALDQHTVLTFIKEFEDRFLKKQDYCMDGCVIKFDSIEKQLQLGYTQKVPKWAKAFKFKQESASTKLLDVEWQMGRTGKLTPVGILEPVEIDGSTVSKASLNNIDYINQLNLQIGAYVFVEKGGAVIPKVTGVDYERCLTENIELE